MEAEAPDNTSLQSRLTNLMEKLDEAHKVTSRISSEEGEAARPEPQGAVDILTACSDSLQNLTNRITSIANRVGQL